MSTGTRASNGAAVSGTLAWPYEVNVVVSRAQDEHVQNPCSAAASKLFVLNVSRDDMHVLLP